MYVEIHLYSDNPLIATSIPSSQHLSPYHNIPPLITSQHLFSDQNIYPYFIFCIYRCLVASMLNVWTLWLTWIFHVTLRHIYIELGGLDVTVGHHLNYLQIANCNSRPCVFWQGWRYWKWRFYILLKYLRIEDLKVERFEPGWLFLLAQCHVSMFDNDIIFLFTT